MITLSSPTIKSTPTLEFPFIHFCPRRVCPKTILSTGAKQFAEQSLNITLPLPCHRVLRRSVSHNVFFIFLNQVKCLDLVGSVLSPNFTGLRVSKLQYTESFLSGHSIKMQTVVNSLYFYLLVV